MSGSKLFGVSCWWRLFYWSLWKKHSLWLAAFISVIIDQCYYWSVLLLISVIIGLSGKDVLCFQESQIWTKIELHRKCKHPTKHLSVRPSTSQPIHSLHTNTHHTFQILYVAVLFSFHLTAMSCFMSVYQITFFCLSLLFFLCFHPLIFSKN